MKKSLLVILLVLSLFLVGCGSDKEEKEKESAEDIEAKTKIYEGNAAVFSTAVVNLVNEGHDIRLYQEGILMMIPVGDTYYKNGGNSCVNIESGGKSPFDSKWNYAYVGVVYVNYGYKYYFISEDGAGYAIPFSKKEELYSDGYKLIKKGANDSYSSYLKKQYTITSNDEHVLNDTERQLFNKAIADHDITKVIYVSSSNCSAY